MSEITLKQVCEKYGVTRRAVQGYEKQKLVRATGKTNRGYLLYDDRAQEQISMIKMLQNFGFSIKEISVYQTADLNGQIEMLENKMQRLKENRNLIETNLREIQELLKLKKREFVKR